MPPRKKGPSGKFEPKDRYYHAAKAAGFKSRAAFKLQGIDAKYHLLKAGQTVVDLGAAPGGWSQVALNKVGKAGFVLAIDLQPITGLQKPNFEAIEADILEKSTITAIQARCPAADVVLTDMAPATTGIKFQDQARSAELVRQALVIARQLLKNGGHFVAKVFPSEDAAVIKKELKQSFTQVQEFTPEATRQTSNEVYFVALRYRGAKGGDNGLKI